MKMKILVNIIIATAVGVVLSMPVTARTRTTQTQIKGASMAVPALTVEAVDSTLLSQTVNPSDIGLRGFAKRASDTKESFLVTNNTQHRMSSVRLLMRYTTVAGAMLHERRITVPVNLGPGDTQWVTVRSFDTQRIYYYYAGPKPRKQATPFRVSYLLLGYDIAVGNY